MPIVKSSNLKGLWRRSQKIEEPPMIDGKLGAKGADGHSPVTLAIIGCGQRGKVSTIQFVYSLLDRTSRLS